jgi:hypothetical protein
MAWLLLWRRGIDQRISYFAASWWQFLVDLKIAETLAAQGLRYKHISPIWLI